MLFGGSDMDLRKKRRCPKEFLGGSPIEEDRFACEHRFVLHWQPFDSTRCFLHWKFATLGLAETKSSVSPGTSVYAGQKDMVERRSTIVGLAIHVFFPSP